MKPFFAWVLSLVLILSLAGCSAQAPAATAAPTAEAAAAPEPTAAPTPTAAPQETAALEPSPEASAAPEASDAPSGGKTLVVYYSATGNTQEAANLIAELTGGDLFELEPADPYTDEDLNYSDENSRVVYEHDNPTPATWPLCRTRSITGRNTTRCFSATRSGGASRPGP